MAAQRSTDLKKGGGRETGCLKEQQFSTSNTASVSYIQHQEKLPFGARISKSQLRAY